MAHQLELSFETADSPQGDESTETVLAARVPDTFEATLTTRKSTLEPLAGIELAFVQTTLGTLPVQDQPGDEAPPTL